MADSDPISDSTPNKRRKLGEDGSHTAKAWDSQNDSGDEVFENFETVATEPLASSQKRKPMLSYPAAAFHSDMQTMTARTAPTHQNQNQTYVTQSTQPLQSQTLRPHVTQPTQPLPPPEVLVQRSSPPVPSPQKPPPAPVQRAFTKPRTGILAGLAPAGTQFRAPVNVSTKPQTVSLDSDEEDPPVEHSDDETQGLRSNIRPTTFVKNGRGIDSTPNRGWRSDRTTSDRPATSDSVQESPPVRKPVSKPAPPAPRAGGGTFSNLMRSFEHTEPSKPVARPVPSDVMASAYGSQSRAPKPQMQKPAVPARLKSATNTVRMQLHDIEDYVIRKKVDEMQSTFPQKSVQELHDALARKRGNKEDAIAYLLDDEDDDAPFVVEDDFDELGTMSPVVKRGVAVSKSQQQTQSSQPVKPSAKQEVKATTTIADRYAMNRKPSKPQLEELPSDSEEDVAPKPRRLLKGRKPGRSPTPPSSPPAQKATLTQPRQRLQQRAKAIVISDDEDESDSGVGREMSEDVAEPEDPPQREASDERLLKWFNECSVRDLAELSAQKEEDVQYVLSKRPFASLQAIERVTNAPETKNGKRSRARPVGEKIVEIASQMWEGYEAVDDLVAQCEKLAEPIQKALKGWGAGDNGELQLMNLDEAHDSGIGTPASSCPSDEAAPSGSKKSKSGFLGQPDNMERDIELKDYQLVGLNWLHLLFKKEISCILADDMGLGKTCQVIAFLSQLKKENVDGVHLVIVPGSTLANWLNEFNRFASVLQVFPYYAGDKERENLRYQIENSFDTIDVIVTTYDIAFRPDDNRFLRKQVQPMVCVFDEAHMLRNPNSLRYKQLLNIPADFRLLLTGTPLQNNLLELVAILAFIMPSLFEEKKEKLDFIFKHKASTKDASHAALLSAERIARARTMMTPFILRRKKAQVLDLPAKHRRIEWCDMTPSQLAFYKGLEAEASRMLSEGPSADKRGKVVASRTSNVIMMLRQAAIHPLLRRHLYTDTKIDKIVVELRKHDEFGGNPSEKIKDFLISESNTGVNLKGGDYALHKFCSDRPYLAKKFALKKQEWMDCGKVQKFKELVTAYTANGDRVLVFSQFTTLMDILEAVMETLAIRFMRLDGSTKMEVRQDMIDKFYTDTSIPVFMLSTKAGGAGINLAAANKVIIFDSGFNPQDDIQAENRAHRVGQTRDVEVVRLVTKGTIEEQIHALGESKLALDERVAGEGATAADEKQAEKEGEKLVQQMFVQSLQKKEETVDEASESKPSSHGDLKDAFRAGLEGKGLKVKSKQAQY